MALSLSRKPHLANKIVMVGGLDGCCKTLFSPIISALERVELFPRREDISREASEEVMLILDKLCEDYEKLYWNPDNFTQT